MGNLFFTLMHLPLDPLLLTDPTEYTQTIELKLPSQQQIHVYQIQLDQDISQLVRSPTFPAVTCLDAHRLCSLFQLKIACTKALLNEQRGKKKTRSIYSDILYSLGPDTSVSACFKRFGVSESTREIIIVCLATPDTIQGLEHELHAALPGRWLPHIELKPDPFLLKVYSCPNMDQLEDFALAAMALQGH